MSGLRVLLAVLALAACCDALDREAFTITHYDLDVRLEPAQQRLGVRGTITLRNDSAQPQHLAVLQISSSLNWRMIRAAAEPGTGSAVQFLTQPYTSDIDHTGELSEAIVTLPREIAPKESIDLVIGYEGVIALDTTRLVRLGTPAAVARHSDWDQIGKNDTALRGVGYVIWYPVAMEAQNLLDGGAMFAAMGKWKERHAASTMELRVNLIPEAATKPELLVNATGCARTEDATTGEIVLSGCRYDALGFANPTLVVGTMQEFTDGPVRVHFLAEHAEVARELVQQATRAEFLVKDWFGTSAVKPEVVDLADADGAPYEAGAWLLLPLAKSRPETEHLLAVHQLAHAAFPSPRLWIYEGAAHFAQTVAQEKDGRAAALAYLETFREALIEGQKAGVVSEPLANTTQEALYNSKAALVWWMLRDMVGDAALKRTLRLYRAAGDKDAAHFEHLLEAESKRDLAWFFQDWVYTDAGLPELHIESVNTRQTNGTSYLTAVTVTNTGGAGAEVAVTVHTNAGDFPQRLEVHGHGKAVTRISTPAQPLEVVVNDGSVPEVGTTSHHLKIAGEAAPQ